jgi:hypothetical protein
MKNLVIYSILLALIISCQATVPATVNHTGTVETKNTITIEIAIPPELLAAFQNTCKVKCQTDPQPTICEQTCNAEQQVQYTQQLTSLLTLLQSTLKPTPTGTP